MIFNIYSFFFITFTSFAEYGNKVYLSKKSLKILFSEATHPIWINLAGKDLGYKSKHILIDIWHWPFYSALKVNITTPVVYFTVIYIKHLSLYCAVKASKNI